MSVAYFDGYWTVETTCYARNYLFLYGDNDIHRGKGGQAVIRDMPNTYGIPTKKLPNNHPNSFYTDEEYDENVQKIKAAFDAVKRIMHTSTIYEGIMLPKDGFGTGLAQLNTRAPRTFQYLCEQVDELVKFMRMSKEERDI